MAESGQSGDSRRRGPPSRPPAGRTGGRAPSPPPTPPPPADEPTEQVERLPGSARAGLAAIISCAPAWLISVVVHAAAVPVLALLTISAVEPVDEIVIASRPATVTEQLEEIEPFDIETPESLEVSEEMLFSAPDVDPGAIELGETAPPAELLADVSDLSVADSSVDEIGALLGSEGIGMTTIGEGLKGMASFFGSKSQGSRFVFVVDNSNSMSGGRLETALLELGRAINKLQPNQYFYVIFYSDTAYPLFHPDPVQGLVPATDKNKRRLAQWLPQIEMCLRTEGRDAMKMALALQPDVVYILGDGAFTDDTAKQLVANPVKNVVIHTLGMQVKPNVVAAFSGIAMKHRGTYKDVGVSPEGLALSRRYPRTRHRNRSSIWGLKLPPARNFKD